jgi:hypothetical protein
MAKSIYEILDDLNTETSVPGEGTVGHTLPRELLPTAEQFENGPALVAWAEEQGITHAVLQKGVQKFLIELRATFKAVKKDETWSLASGQKAVDDATWRVTSRPNVKKSAEETSRDYLDSLTHDEQAAFLLKMAEKLGLADTKAMAETTERLKNMVADK